MVKYIVFISLFVSQILLITLNANGGSLKLNKLDELRILSSLDIKPSFVNDQEYIQMKNKIDKLKTMYFLKTLKKGNIFMPNLHELLGDANIPDTFLYMAMVESKFLADVKSHKNAAGLWQLMPKTAKKFNLEINSKIDERLDPIRSTKVAIQYLNELHQRFGKWYLAAIAYNCGQTRLARVIKKVGSDDISVLLDSEKKYLPTETRDYMRRIIVAALLAYDDEIIVKNNANHLFGNCTNSKLVEVFFDGGVSLKEISKKVNIPIQMIKTCNPHLLNSKLPSNKKTYHVYIPQELISNLKKDNKKITIGRFTYSVKEGDTLFLISKRFNNKIEAIKRLNPHLKKSLEVGQEIVLIGENLEVKKEQTSIEINSKSKVFIYKVKKGDTPYTISMKFNNRFQTIKDLNPDFPQNLKEGVSLKIKR